MWDIIDSKSSERSAARLAHQSGGLGVPSSNLGAPTKKTEGARNVQTSAGGDCRTEYFRRRGFGAGGESRRCSALPRNRRRICPPNGSGLGAFSELEPRSVNAISHYLQ